LRVQELGRNHSKALFFDLNRFDAFEKQEQKISCKCSFTQNIFFKAAVFVRFVSTKVQRLIMFPIAENAAVVPLSQVAALQGRQLGRSLAGVLSGAAANLRSRLAGIADTSGRSGPRGSPSPPLSKKEDRVR
jgi:hypothetical protein